MAFGIYQLYHLLQPRFRQARRRLLREFLQRTPAATILDLGGNVYDWLDFPTTARITILILRSGDNANLPSLFTELRLLSARQLQNLFPESTIHRERLLGLTKSLIAAKPSL